MPEITNYFKNTKESGIDCDSNGFTDPITDEDDFYTNALKKRLQEAAEPAAIDNRNETLHFEVCFERKFTLNVF